MDCHDIGSRYNGGVISSHPLSRRQKCCQRQHLPGQGKDVDNDSGLGWRGFHLEGAPTMDRVDWSG